MRTASWILVTLLLLPGCTPPAGTRQSIEGSWQPVQPAAVENMTFSSNGTVVVRQNGVDLPPVDFALNSNTVPATLTMDGREGTVTFLPSGEIEIVDPRGQPLRLKRVP